MGSLISKLSSLLQPNLEGDPSLNPKLLSEQVNEWQDSCVELIKDCFVKLFPLTEAMGRLLVVMVQLTEFVFRWVSATVTVFSAINGLEPLTNISWTDCKNTDRSEYLQKLEKFCKDAFHQFEDDFIISLSVAKVVDLFVHMIKSMYDWSSKIQVNHLNCQCSKWMEKTMKRLAIIVGTFKMEVQELIWKRRLMSIIFYP